MQNVDIRGRQILNKNTSWFGFGIGDVVFSSPFAYFVSQINVWSQILMGNRTTRNGRRVVVSIPLLNGLAFIVMTKSALNRFKHQFVGDGANELWARLRHDCLPTI